MESAIEPERLIRFFSVLANELRAKGVTVLYSMETRDVLGSGLELPMGGISSLVEGLIALRFLERRSATRRLLSVVKMRGGPFDPSLREFVITHGHGVSLTGTFEDVEDLLTGFPRDRPIRSSASPEPEAR
jgi:circadian clock protein KaiC